MDIDPEHLISQIRSSAPSPIARLKLATETASNLARIGDQLVDEFVEEARRSGHGWVELAPLIPNSGDPASAGGRSGLGEPSTASVAARRHNMREHTGKYRLLWEWLTHQTQSEIDTTFAEIEEVLGFQLPQSCRDHSPHWYGYDGSAVARAIADAGWRARNVNLSAETLTLTRETPDALVPAS